MTDKQMQEPVDWEAVAADQAMTIALLKSEAAAQRQWVGLTGDEIVNMMPDDDTPMSLGEAIFNFAELVEAMLKEKNT